MKEKLDSNSLRSGKTGCEVGSNIAGEKSEISETLAEVVQFSLVDCSDGRCRLRAVPTVRTESKNAGAEMVEIVEEKKSATTLSQ